MPSESSNNDPPQYEGYSRPSVGGCLVGVVLGLLIILAAYFVALAVFKEGVAVFAVPGIVLLVVVVVAAIYYARRNRRHPDVDPTTQAAKREQFEHWMDEEMEAAHPETSAQPPQEPPADDSA